MATEAEQLLTTAWMGARAGELLIWDHIISGNPAIKKEEDGSWDLQPGVQRLMGFLSVQARILKPLGLERRAKDVHSLEHYMRENYGREKAEEKD